MTGVRWHRVAGVATLLSVAACSDDPGPLRIRYRLTTDEAQTCPSASCADIAVTCDAVLQIRVVNPARPAQAYVSACLPVDDAEDLCAISRDDLPEGLSIPSGTVEVQVSVFPRSMATTAPDGSLRCPAPPAFGADGMPTLVEPVPALGGRAFASADTAEIVVPLGCTDLSRIDNETCAPLDVTAVRAGVDEFDSRVYVSPGTAVTLSAAVGEPVARLDPDSGQLRYVLDAASTTPLLLDSNGPVPAWSANAQRLFTDVACITVLEDAPSATTAVACRRVNPGQPEVNLTGYRVPRPRVDDALAALGLPDFPSSGMVLGVVVGRVGTPVAGAEVQVAGGTVTFLDETGTAASAGTTTTASGLFVSTDAPFGGDWLVTGAGPVVNLPVGGLVTGKLTVMVIELDEDA